MTHPEALRLADALETAEISYTSMVKAAAELRRLHEAHDWQYRMAGERLRRIEKLEAQRDALLEACKVALGIVGFGKEHDQIAAAIKAVEEGK